MFRSNNTHKIVMVRVIGRPHMEDGRAHRAGSIIQVTEKRAAELIGAKKVILHHETAAMTAPEMETKEAKNDGDFSRFPLDGKEETDALREEEETEEERLTGLNEDVPRDRSRAARRARRGRR